jgi:hypothetical protein
MKLKPLFPWKITGLVSGLGLLGLLYLVYQFVRYEEPLPVGLFALVVIACVALGISLAEGVSTLLGRRRK